MSGYSLALSPLLPWWAIAVFVAAAVLALGFGGFRRARGLAWRFLALTALVLILIDPSLVVEQRDPQHDVAAVVVDDSPSMRIGERRQFADAALNDVLRKLQQQKNLDVRVIHAGAPDP